MFLTNLFKDNHHRFRDHLFLNNAIKFNSKTPIAAPHANKVTTCIALIQSLFTILVKFQNVNMITNNEIKTGLL